MWPSAVRLCLACPVRQSCLDEALRQRDNGVIRGGMLLVDTSRGYAAVPLICANCGLRPVRLTRTGGVPRYCGRTCQVTSYRRRSRPVPTGSGATAPPQGRGLSNSSMVTARSATIEAVSRTPAVISTIGTSSSTDDTPVTARAGSNSTRTAAMPV